MKKFGLFAIAAIALTACGDNSVSHNEPIDSNPDTSSSFTDTNYSSEASITSSSSETIDISSSSTETGPIQFTNGSIIRNDEVLDLRDGKTYKTTVIGNQVWMAEDLKLDVRQYFNDNAYPTHNDFEGRSFENIYSALEELYFEQELSADSDNKTNYYFWPLAVDSAGLFSSTASECAKTGDCSGNGFIRGICPEGFHIPDSSEVEQLYRAIGGKCSASKLKAQSNRWTATYNEGTDDYGFSAFPNGFYSVVEDNGLINYFSNSECPTEYLTTKIWTNWGIVREPVWQQGQRKDLDFLFVSQDKACGTFITVRCLRDEPAGVDWIDPPAPTAPALPEFEYGEFTDERDGKTYKIVVVNGKTWMDQNLAYSLTDDDFEEVYKLSGSRPPSDDVNNVTCKHPLLGNRISCNYKFKIDSTYCKAHETSCKNYGKFYSWYEANVVCPAGWRLPTTEEMNDFMESPNPYVVYEGPCFSRYISFENLIDNDFNKLINEDLIKVASFEFWTSSETSHSKNYALTSMNSGLSKGADANVRCIKE